MRLLIDGLILTPEYDTNVREGTGDIVDFSAKSAEQIFQVFSYQLPCESFYRLYPDLHYTFSQIYITPNLCKTFHRPSLLIQREG